LSEQAADREALDTARELTGALTSMRDEVSALKDRLADQETTQAAQADALAAQKEYEKKSRHMTWLAFCSIGVDVLFTIFLVLNHTATQDARVEAAQARQSAAVAQQVAHVAQHDNMALCLSSNKARAQTIGVWTFLVHLGPPPQTTQGRAIVTKFFRHLDILYAPRDCSHISPTSP
jgi:hypothetical protein